MESTMTTAENAGRLDGGDGAVPPITAQELAGRLSELMPIGLSASGTNRLAWTDEDAAAAEWFATQAASAGLRVERDPAGNLWACPEGEGPWWAVGSHLDSVRDGGRYDGALGLAAAFAVAARTRAPVAVISFADEEGARYNTPTFGSRALVGRLDVEEALGRVDVDGVALGAAIAAAGVDPERLGEAPRWLDRLHGFLELHIDQTRDLAAAGRPAGVVERLVARRRLQVEIVGCADHAGTTRRGERRDALVAAARLIVSGDDLASGYREVVFTPGRIEVEPNALTTVPARVRLWLDARASDAAELDAWHGGVTESAAAIVERTGVQIDLRVAAQSPGGELSSSVRAVLADGLARAQRGAGAGAVTELVCFAGHDAGVLALKRPTGMVLVRNETGISHSPAEEVSLEDAAVGAMVLLHAVEQLA
jgi:N-carbamoyl-L-amino-acid hydrolase